MQRQTQRKDDSKGTSESLSLDIEDVCMSRQGDGDAYRRLIERHQEHVSQIMWRFSRDLRLHEELVQDVFVEAYLSLATYRGKAPFAHWLSRIATRVGYAYLKQSARHHAKEGFTLQEWDELTDDFSKEIEPSHAAALLYRLLEKLPSRDRLVLTLRYFEDCDIAETARRTGWSKAMVKVQTWRARKKLRKLLQKTGLVRAEPAVARKEIT
jgi:RNA polymerase sigma-70 factor (ECF subfamily)